MLSSKSNISLTENLGQNFQNKYKFGKIAIFYAVAEEVVFFSPTAYLALHVSELSSISRTDGAAFGCTFLAG